MNKKEVQKVKEKSVELRNGLFKLEFVKVRTRIEYLARLEKIAINVIVSRLEVYLGKEVGVWKVLSGDIKNLFKERLEMDVEVKSSQELRLKVCLWKLKIDKINGR